MYIIFLKISSYWYNYIDKILFFPSKILAAIFNCPFLDILERQMFSLLFYLDFISYLVLYISWKLRNETHFQKKRFYNEKKSCFHGWKSNLPNSMYNSQRTKINHLIPLMLLQVLVGLRCLLLVMMKRIDDH